MSANQVGLDKRMFVMLSDSDNKIYDFVNPVVVDHAEIKSNVLFKEGCLSSKGVYDYVPRYEWILIEYQDRTGEDRSVYVTNKRDVVCIQHEMDHLDGIFWWDRLPKNSRKRLIRKWEKKNK